jgi:hypothetical protein
VKEVHQPEDGDQRHRNCHCDERGAPWAAEKQYEDNKDEAAALEHRVRNLVDGRAHEVVAIDVRHDANAFGLELLVELVDLGMDGLQHLGGVLLA